MNNSDDEEKVTFSNCHERLSKIKKLLPDSFSNFGIRPNTERSFKCFYFAGAHIHRFYQSGLSSLALFKNNKDIPAILTARSVLEDLALLYDFQLKAERLFNSKDFEKFDKYLMRVISGSRESSHPYKSINVLTFIDQLSKHAPSVRPLYDILSEFSHPNYHGVLKTYSKIDIKNLQIQFGNNRDIPDIIILTPLLVSFRLFEPIYKLILVQASEIDDLK